MDDDTTPKPNAEEKPGARIPYPPQHPIFIFHRLATILALPDLLDLARSIATGFRTPYFPRLARWIWGPKPWLKIPIYILVLSGIGLVISAAFFYPVNQLLVWLYPAGVSASATAGIVWDITFLILPDFLASSTFLFAFVFAWRIRTLRSSSFFQEQLRIIPDNQSHIRRATVAQVLILAILLSFLTPIASTISALLNPVVRRYYMTDGNFPWRLISPSYLQDWPLVIALLHDQILSRMISTIDYFLSFGLYTLAMIVPRQGTNAVWTVLASAYGLRVFFRIVHELSYALENHLATSLQTQPPPHYLPDFASSGLQILLVLLAIGLIWKFTRQRLVEERGSGE